MPGATPRTDFVHDTEHALLRDLAIGRAVEVDFRCDLSGQFDQAGAYLQFDGEHWIKSGVEHSDGVDMLGGVVTMGRSDWSTGPVPDWSGRVVTIRISRAQESVTVRARVDAGPYQLVRVAPTPPGATGIRRPLPVRAHPRGASASTSSAGARPTPTAHCTSRAPALRGRSSPLLLKPVRGGSERRRGPTRTLEPVGGG